MTEKLTAGVAYSCPGCGADMVCSPDIEWQRCEEKLAASRAETARLRAEYLTRRRPGKSRAVGADLETRLTAATKLLERAEKALTALGWHHGAPAVEIRVFLAAQPDPARGCVHNDFMRGMVCDECAQPAPAQTEPDEATKAALQRNADYVHYSAQTAPAQKNPYVCEPDCESPRCPVKVWDREHPRPEPSTLERIAAEVDSTIGHEAQSYRVIEAIIAQARARGEL